MKTTKEFSKSINKPKLDKGLAGFSIFIVFLFAFLLLLRESMQPPLSFMQEMKFTYINNNQMVILVVLFTIQLSGLIVFIRSKVSK
nr:hypothetical protein [uncultured Psychroserpens sp.]